MGCKNVGDSNKHHRQNNKHSSDNQQVAERNEEGRTEIITKEVIETVQPDGSVVKQTIIQKSYEEPASKGNNVKKKEVKFKDGNSSDSDEGEDKGGELNLNKFIQEALQTHNQLRSKHRSPALRVNQELNKIAQKYAEKIAKSNSFEHSDNTFKGDNLGENLFMCGGYLITGKEMSQQWYNEIKDYNFNKATFGSNTGHFTQLIWADSIEVGFGAAKAKDGSYYGVANYYPAGNVMGNFAPNVKRA